MKPVIHTSKTDTKTLILCSNWHPGSKTDTKVRFLFPYEVD